MGRLSLKNVCIKRGNLYFRRKVAGKDTYIALPALDSPDFAPAYARLMKPDAPRDGPKPGTFAALVVSFRKSTLHKGARESTRQNRERYLAMISSAPSKPVIDGDPKLGTRAVKGLRPFHLYSIRDAMADTPGKFNNYLSVMRLLLTHACQTDERSDNPALTVQPLKLGEHEPWPAELLQVCYEIASPMLRLAIVTALCSGQRISDLIRMQHRWIEGGIMAVQSIKTETTALIPVHPLWTAEMAKVERRAVTLLYDRFGRPFQSTGTLQARVRDLMAHPRVVAVLADLREQRRIKADDSFSFHGLSKNACCYLAELGLNDSQSAAIVGKTPETVRHYAKRARALMIAKTAADQITGGNIVLMKGGTEKNAAR